jgi:succinate dehydrogenase/fumarate reductase cytochrome b subunit
MDTLWRIFGGLVIILVVSLNGLVTGIGSGLLVIVTKVVWHLPTCYNETSAFVCAFVFYVVWAVRYFSEDYGYFEKKNSDLATAGVYIAVVSCAVSLITGWLAATLF